MRDAKLSRLAKVNRSPLAEAATPALRLRNLSLSRSREFHHRTVGAAARVLADLLCTCIV